MSIHIVKQIEAALKYINSLKDMQGHVFAWASREGPPTENIIVLNSIHDIDTFHWHPKDPKTITLKGNSRDVGG